MPACFARLTCDGGVPSFNYILFPRSTTVTHAATPLAPIPPCCFNSECELLFVWSMHTHALASQILPIDLSHSMRTFIDHKRIPHGNRGKSTRRAMQRRDFVITLKALLFPR
jgi:hypothetical protein